MTPARDTARLRVATLNTWGTRGDWPARRRVLVRGGEHGGPALPIAACERIFDRPEAEDWGSDHSGLVADLSAPVRPTGEGGR